MKIRPVPGVVVVAGFRVTWTLRARTFCHGASAPPECVFGTGRHSQGLIFWFSGFSVLSFSVFSFFGFCFFGFQFLVFGFWFLVFGFWFLVFGFWFLVFGFWFLVFGFWFLVFGFRFSVSVFSFRFSVFSVFGFQFQSSVGQHFRKIALIFK